MYKKYQQSNMLWLAVGQRSQKHKAFEWLQGYKKAQSISRWLNAWGLAVDVLSFKTALVYQGLRCTVLIRFD